jgi:hypothetical protein
LGVLDFLVLLLLLLRLIVTLLRLLGLLLLLEGDQHLLAIPCGGQGVHLLLLLLLLLLLMLRGRLMHHLVLGRLWALEDGRRWGLLLWGLSCHVHGAMRGLNQDGLRLMDLLIDWLGHRLWLIM